MWFTKNFRALWWLVLILCLSIFLSQRYADLSSGEAKPIDFLLFVVWIGVCLGPLFAEIHLPGLTLKQKIEEAKVELTRDIESLRSEIRNSVDVRSNVSPNFWVGVGSQPPPDDKLGEVEKRLHAAIERLERRGYSIDDSTARRIPSMLSEREQIMFASRRDIESELRAIAAPFDNEVDRLGFAPITKVLWLLTRNEIIDRQMANVIREVYSICSHAIHGKEITESQVEFVLKNGPELVNALRAIHSRDG